MPGKRGPVGGVDAVRVEGLADFQRELRELDGKLPRQLGQVNKAAAEMIAAKARTRAQSEGGVAAKSAPALKAMAEQRRSKIILDGQKYPYALGAEFGGRARPTTQQFREWRGSGATAGYFLYPTIRDNADEYMALYERSIDQLMRQAFPS